MEWPTPSAGTMAWRFSGERDGLMAGTTMAKKRMGRPKTSERQDVSIKFDRALARKARMIAEARNIAMAEYLSEMARPIIDRDYVRVMRELEGGPK
jgi:hypothetical protein